MSVLLDSFLIHHPSNVREDLITLMKEGTHLYNGTYYLLTPRRSLHYRALATGDFVPYNEIISSHDESLGHSEEAFRHLAKTFSPDKMENIRVNVFFHTKKLWVVDGAHRLAIAAYQKVWGNSIPVCYVDASYQPDLKTYLEDKLRSAANAQATPLSPQATPLSPQATPLSPHGLYSVDLYNFRISGPIPSLHVADCLRRSVCFEGKTVFHLGCGSGTLLFHLPECAKVVGVDPLEDCVKCCQRWGSWLFYATTYDFSLDQGIASTMALLLDTRPDICIASLVSHTCPTASWSDRRLMARLLFAIHGHMLLETDQEDVLDDYASAHIVLLWNGVPAYRVKWFCVTVHAPHTAYATNCVNKKS